MSYIVKTLKKEHWNIKKILSELESLIKNCFSSEWNNIIGAYIIDLFDDLIRIWNRHERKEEEFLRKYQSEFNNEAMFVEEHRELRGHWNAINESIGLGDDSFRIALITDGKMLIEKFRDHIRREDRFFNSLEKTNRAPHS